MTTQARTTPRDLHDLPRVEVPVGDLLAAHSPRIRPVNAAHVRTLAEVYDQLDPILVHHPTMRVIDGMHRLQAARDLGRTSVVVQYFEGGEDDAFLLSVQLNVRHGLPLSLAERKNAAARVIASRPQWSDRAIAACTGLSPKTVGRLRKEATEEIPQLTARVGRDGRVRRLGGRSGIPQVAPVAVARVPARPEQARPETLLRKLARDPAFRGTESGRLLLRMLIATEVNADEWRAITENVPLHSVPWVRAIAADRIEQWTRLAQIHPPLKVAEGH